MGQLICHRRERSTDWLKQCTYARTYHKEKVEDLPGPQGPQQGTGTGTILLKDSRRAHLKVQWSHLLHHCRLGQRILAGHITSWFPEVHLHGLRHQTFPVEETPHGNNRCIRCISKEVGFHLHWTPRSHRHCWWHDYLQNHQRLAWPEPASISTSHKRQRTSPEQRQDTVQEDWSLILWTQMVEGWTLTRPKEDTINNQHGFSGGQGNNALFPRDGEFPKLCRDGEFPKLLLTTTGQALCTSQKPHPERHTLPSHGWASSSLRTTQAGIHNRNHASLLWQE